MMGLIKVLFQQAVRTHPYMLTSLYAQCPEYAPFLAHSKHCNEGHDKTEGKSLTKGRSE